MVRGRHGSTQIRFTEEQKRELISLRLDKRYSLDQLAEHCRQNYNLSLARQTMSNHMNLWDADLTKEVQEQIAEKKLATGMDQLSRINDWSIFRSLVKDRFVEKLKNGKDLKFSELADMLLKADDKLASLLGVKEAEVVKHELTVDFAPLFEKIRAAKRIDNVQDAEVEECDANQANP